jgi:GNAT superfamily N-acetyltransferase
MPMPRTLASTRSCLAAMAERAGRRLERDGITAVSMPQVPERSLTNSVFYEPGANIASAYGWISDFYAGVNAWTVWVPEDDRGVADLLESHGHVLDANPADMELSLADFEPSIELPDWDHGTAEQLAEINDAAYPWRDGTLARALRDGVGDDDFRIYVVDDLCALAIHDVDDDAYVTFVATRPEGRGRGLASGLLAAALVEARERGQTVSTLGATKIGEPVYARLGYRKTGVSEMWEMRT